MKPVQQDVNVAEAERLLAGVSGPQAAGREIADVRFGPVEHPAHGARWRPVDARQLAFRNVDWTHGSILGGLLGRGRVQECRFERVNLDDSRCQKVDFVDCNFERVTFGEDFLGLIKDCTFARCFFVKCRFDAVEFVESTLRSCRFEEIKGVRAGWRECVLEDVALSGTLVKTNFISNVFRRVDMSAAELQDSALVYTREGDVDLPDRPDNFAIDAQLFLDAEPVLSSRLKPEALETYRRLAKEWAPFGAPFIVYAGVVDEIPARERAVVLETLYEMRHRRPIRSHVSSTPR
jgi:uncharacterized protein YjbI with pentapeptide repeats